MRGNGLQVTEVAHAGRVDGTQTVTGYYRGATRLSLSLVLVGRQAYVLANAGALQHLVGFKLSAALDEAGKWFVVPASDQAIFEKLAAGLTVTSATQQLNLVGELAVLPARKLAGRAVVGVSGTTMAFGAPGTQTVYMRAVGAPLPVEAVQDYEGVVQSMSFAQWGQVPVAKARAGALHFERSWLA